jgi:hypothetical protein
MDTTTLPKLFPRNFIIVVVALSLFFNFLGVKTEQQQTKGNLLLLNHTTATLSETRSQLAATCSGEFVFFAGGRNETGQASDRVDILNVSSGIWTTAALSQPRSELAATSSRNLVLFGGGLSGTTYSDLVDI